MKCQNIVLLGSTGSIGTTTLSILRRFPQHFRLIGISGGSRREELEKIAAEFDVPHVIFGQNHTLLSELAALPEADRIIIGLSGISALNPLLSAINANKIIALANKESLVVGGNLIGDTLRNSRATLLPLDSEHHAIFQCLRGENAVCFQKTPALEKIFLTASGGPFRRFSSKELSQVTATQALRHPHWQMGQKISIDSATLANKGLEEIEAHWLFDLPPEKIDVLVHPESAVHSLVQFCDGSLLAQLSPASMEFPLIYSLFHPQRMTNSLPRLNLLELGALHFEAPDRQRFPCLRLAEEALREGKSLPCIFEGANSVAVNAFLRQEISFLQIPQVIERTMDRLAVEILLTTDAVHAKYEESQRIARQIIPTLSPK